MQYSIKQYSVFPGISILFFSSHTERISLTQNLQNSNFIDIYHCAEGRMECNINDSFAYISPGDLLIAKANAVSDEFSFPFKHYHGIIIRIDVDNSPKCLSCFLRDVNVQPKAIADKFCGNKEYYIARSNASVEHIFSELYDVSDEVKNGYYKIKVLELMLFLSVYKDEENPENNPFVSKCQANLAKEIAGHITNNMDEKLTLEQASKLFHASATNIKNAFKAVFGVPFYSFIKAQKMESASYMLEHTDKSITEIAGEHGYENSGKFAGAFKSIKGITPREYRIQKRKI